MREAVTVRDSIVVDADPDTIMDVIADFEAYPDWQDEVATVEILETDEDGWGTQVRFVIDATGLRATMVVDYAYSDTRMSWDLVESDRLRSSSGSYTLVDRGDGTTRVLYELEVDPEMALPGIIKRAVARRILDGALTGMKRRVESR